MGRAGVHEYSTDEVLLEANPARRDGASGVGFIRCAAPACLDSLEQQQRPCPCARALEIEFEGAHRGRRSHREMLIFRWSNHFG